MTAGAEVRTGKAVQRGLPLSIQRMTGLRTAASFLGGQEALADALGVEPRSLRSKLDASRGISDAELAAAADALDARAARIVELAGKLRLEAGVTSSDRTLETQGASA